MFAAPASSRLQVSGKYFSRQGEKVYLSGLTYGPFGPGTVNGGLHSPEQSLRDLQLLREMGANALRLYHVPPDWFLDLCGEHGLSAVISLPWMDHVDFLRERRTQRQVREQLVRQARLLASRTEVGALLVGNEINSTLVRWLGPRRVLQFLEELIDSAKQAAPDTLVTYANYPSTEYLLPENADFAAYNIYLESRPALTRYLARLQNLAGDRPLVISEFGVDALHHGAARQAETLAWQRDIAAEAGVAGNFLFAFTDDWHRGGQQVTGWEFGVVDRARVPKPSYFQLQTLGPLKAPDVNHPPSFSVIVCTRNGSRTLEQCLYSLEQLCYPRFELIVVDDGSSDHTREIILAHPRARYLFQEPAGLSVARNLGADHATGEILAYTDDDCVVDRDWLTYLAMAFRDPAIAAAGGPNIPPPPENLSQACVIAAPGGPAHVLLTDTTAEHVPGCNLAVRKSAFTEVGGFLPKFHAAGDDVDFCWRLMERGYTIGFHPGAMVWHYRRFSIKAYLKQQIGYGNAEGLLLSQHSHRFGHFGGARWRGTVYQPALLRITRQGGRIYSGAFGRAPFQIIYSAPFSDYFHLASSFPWLLLTLALLANFTWSSLLGCLGLAMLLLTLLLPLRQMRHLTLPAQYEGLRARVLLWFLMLAQPVIRSISRFYRGLRSGSVPTGPSPSPRLGRFSLLGWPKRVAELTLWSTTGQDRETLLPLLTTALQETGLPFQADDGWKNWDLEIQASRWWAVRLTTVTEYHQQQDRLTRVRLATRATLPNVLVNLLLCTGLLVLSWMIPWQFALVALAGYFLWWWFFEMLHRRNTRRIAALTLQTAADHGFTNANGPSRT